MKYTWHCIVDMLYSVFKLIFIVMSVLHLRSNFYRPA